MNPLPAPTAGTTAAFVVLAAFVAALAPVAASAAARRRGDSLAAARRLAWGTGLVLVAWLAIPTLLAASGMLARFDRMPPPFGLMMIACFAATTALAFSRFGTLLSAHLPLMALVAFQAFRLPLEAILHSLYIEGVLPRAMTWSGLNFDVVTGGTALVLGLWLAARPAPRPLVLAWNALGTLLLAVVVTIAILAAPFPFRAFHDEPANRIVADVPWVWLPTLLVQAAWFGHLLVFRHLARAAQGEAGAAGRRD
jgi:hypothetical protein